jgi:hypothetical protein
VEGSIEKRGYPPVPGICGIKAPAFGSPGDLTPPFKFSDLSIKEQLLFVYWIMYTKCKEKHKLSKGIPVITNLFTIYQVILKTV